MLNVTNTTPAKLQEKITAMREGGKILGNLLKDLKNYVKPGMTGTEIDAWVRKEIVNRGAKVAYDMLDDEFPGAICISVNDELVHGAPKDIELEEGDKVSFDLDIYYKGYFTDSAFTMLVGNKGSQAVKNMIKVTESSMYEGIEQVRPGAHIGDISQAVEKVLRKGHLGVIENYVGHGIDEKMHDRPEVPNYGKKGRGYKLEEGDTICIEPMSCLGKQKTAYEIQIRDWSSGALPICSVRPSYRDIR